MKHGAAMVVVVLTVSVVHPAAAKPDVAGEVTVFAAASLTESFAAIGEQFEDRYPDASVRFNFDASSNLAAQIQQGSPADVFASADESILQRSIDAGAVSRPSSVFAKNRLEIAVEKGNPKQVKRLADLGKAGLVVVLCDDAVPCGKYAAEAFSKSGVEVSPASKEVDAKAAVGKVALGEADAAVVYVTDIKAAKRDVSGVKIPEAQNVIAAYAAAVVKDTENPAAAKAWVRFLSSKTAQRTVRKFGFLAP